MNRWTAGFIGLGGWLLLTVPVSFAVGDPIWPLSLVVGVCSVGYGLYRWRSRAT